VQSPPIDWFEIVAGPQQPPSLGSTRLVEKLVAGGAAVRLHAIHDQPFWSLPEITVAPKLVAASTALLASRLAQRGH
jgi:hypothetical protein